MIVALTLACLAGAGAAILGLLGWEVLRSVWRTIVDIIRGGYDSWR